MEEFVKDSSVQIAVTVSALLTLIVLSVQGIRFYLMPLVQIAREGWSAAKTHRDAAFQSRVSESVVDSSLLIANSLFIILRLFLTTASMILAAVSQILSAIAFVPGYQAEAASIIILDVSPKAQAIIASVMLMISFVLFFSSILSGTRFVFALRKARRNADSRCLI